MVKHVFFGFLVLVIIVFTLISKSYSNGKQDPNQVVGSVKWAADSMNLGTLQKLKIEKFVEIYFYFSDIR